MADQKISALPAAGAVAGADVVPVVQGGVNVKAPFSVIGAYIRGLFTTTPATIAEGGTGVATAAAARTALGAAKSGANSDITSLTGLTVALPIAEGGTGSTTAATARTALGVFLNNVSATSPTTTDDNTQGYVAGSKWLNTTISTVFVCRDAATNAAIWEKIANGIFPGYISGNYYDFMDEATMNGAGAVNGSLFLYPFMIKEKVTISALAARVTTLSAVGGGLDVVMIGIYAHKASTGRPIGNPLASVTGLSTTAVAGISGVLGSNVTLEPGIYWAAGQAANSTVRMASVINTGKLMLNFIGSATLSNVMAASGYMLTTSNTYGTFPDLTSAAFTESINGSPQAFRIGGKVA